MVLHTVNKPEALASCQRLASGGDTILLIENGVYAATKDGPYSEHIQNLISARCKVYCLTADIAARGLIGKIAEGLEAADYDDFVQLTCDAQTVQSWY